MFPKYSFPINYEEPFKDPWYYPTVCMNCQENTEDYKPEFVWVGGKWFCDFCKKEISNV